MKKFFKGLSAGLAVCATALLAFGAMLASNLPEDYQVTKESGYTFDLHAAVPLGTRALGSGQLADASTAVQSGGHYQCDVMLLDVIPIKSVTVNVVPETYVVPCGMPFGVKIFTEGVVVVGMADVRTEEGTINPAKDAGLKTGDVILSINEVPVNSNEEVAQAVGGCDGQPLVMQVRRSNVTFQTQVTPVKAAADQQYKAGLWVRDSSAGIGTMTFYDPQNQVFAGLGHGICDIDTGELMPLLNGDIVPATINGIAKGTKGTPGELRGYFSDNEAIGVLLSNGETGVYGSMEQAPVQNQAIPVAMKQEVQEGAAQIFTTIDGTTPKSYDIEIQHVDYNADSPTKNMVIRITDPELLEATGGIVQGMSGSPIIQNGKLVGAVTHVFVEEPERGYGIFAENMLKTSGEIARNGQKDAA